VTDLITIKAVPIARVGDWNAAAGTGVLTPEDLQSMVDAAQDPEIQAAGPVRGWLGHNGAVDDWGDPIPRDPYDTAEPAIGTVENLTTADDGQTLVADLVDVPEIVTVLYPQRSIETIGGVVTASGNGYRCVLTGMAYLGRADPAVKGMPDLLDAVRASATGALAAGGVRWIGEPALMSALPADTPPPADDQVVARVTRRALALAARTDLAPAGADHPAAAAATTTGAPVSNPTPPAPNGPANDPTVDPPENDETPQDAVDTDVDADDDEDETEETGTVTVDAAAFAAMQERLAALEERDEQRARADHDTGREQLLTAAIDEGRFPESRRDHYARRYDSDPEGTRAEIDGLTPGVVPTAGRRLASGGAPVTDAVVIRDDEPLPAGLSLLSNRARQRRHAS